MSWEENQTMEKGGKDNVIMGRELEQSNGTADNDNNDNDDDDDNDYNDNDDDDDYRWWQ